MMRMKTLEKARGIRKMKLRVASLNAKKEAVRRCMREAMHIENRMVRLWQFVEGQHAEYRGDRCTENREFECDRNKGRPAIERAAADVHRISDRGDPILKTKAANTARQTSKKSDQRHQVALQSEGLRKPFHGEWSIGIEPAIAGLTDLLHGMSKLLGGREFAHYAVNV